MIANKTYIQIPDLSDSDIKRFWSKVAITANPERCWEWIGSKRRRGYGQFHKTLSNKEEKNFIATRISYFINNKIDPKNNIILHICDNPSCVNPRHLISGTNKDNSIDMSKKGRGKNQFKVGVNHHSNKLTENEVLLIRNEYSKGDITQKNLSLKYKVDSALISRIVNKKLWIHI